MVEFTNGNGSRTNTTMKLKPYMHPAEVFKMLADWEAEVEHCKNYKQEELPKYKKVEIKKNNVGWINFFKELRP